MGDKKMFKYTVITHGYKNNYTVILYHKGEEKKRVEKIKTNTCNGAYKKALRILKL